MKNDDPKLATSGTRTEKPIATSTDFADLDAMFKTLEPVEPRADFLRAVRQIPLQHPRKQNAPFDLFGFRFALGLAASLGLGIVAGTFPLAQSDENSELVAFMDLDAQDQPLDLGYFDAGTE